MGCASSVAACLVPPDGEFLPFPSFPPEVDFGSLRPVPRLVFIGDECNFDVEVNRIIDPDSQVLRIRWVLNNNIPGTRLLEEGILPPLPPGTPQSATEDFGPNDLDDNDDGVLEVGDLPLLSFFVTDAPGWRDDELPDAGAMPDAGSAGDAGSANDGGASPMDGGLSFDLGQRLPARDLGRVVADPSRSQRAVEVTWTFQVIQTGGCIQ